MRSYHHLFLLLSLALSTAAIAQLPPYTLQFVPDGFDTWPRTAKSAYYSFSEVVATPEHLVRMELPTAGKAKGILSTFVKDNATGRIVGQHDRVPPGGKEAYCDRLVQIGGNLYLIYETLDEKTGEVVVYAERIALPTGRPEGEAKKIGSISFDPKSLQWSGKLGVTLYTSSDGEYTAFYFDRLRSKEDEQLVLVFMLDKDLDPVWQQGYRIAFDSEKISTSGVSVSDDGLVYALMGARFKNKAITNKEVNYEFQLFGMSKEGMASQTIDLEGSNDVLTCGLVLRNGTRPTVGGFYVESGSSTEVTAGYFMCDVDPGMEAVPIPRNYLFRTPVEERMYGARLFAKRDGSVFLTGNSRVSNGTSASESNLFATFFDASLVEEWNTLVPKTLITSKTDEDYSYRTFFGNDQLLLMVPELDENIIAHQQKGELKKIRKGADVRMVVGFSDAGVPTFAKFGAPDVYDFFLKWLPGDMEVQPGVHVIPCTKKEGKKAVQGKLVLTFE